MSIRYGLWALSGLGKGLLGAGVARGWVTAHAVVHLLGADTIAMLPALKMHLNLKAIW